MTELESAQLKITDLTIYLKFMLQFDLQSKYDSKDHTLFQGILDNVSNSEITLENQLKTVAILSKRSQPLLIKFPLKVSFNTFVKEIANLSNNRLEELNARGVQVGWLRRKMDLSNYIIPNDFPYHAYFGFGNNKGRYGVEEDILLKDAFNIFVRFNSIYEDVSELMKAHNKKRNDLISKNLPSIHFEMASYARLSIISFLSFFECFINGIAYDFLQTNEAHLKDEDKNLLKGRHRGGRGYLSIEKKLEGFQKIMRSDKEIVIHLTDPKQIHEPFKTLLSDIKGLRNSSVHNSPSKEKIWMSAGDWYSKTTRTAELTIQASLLVWKALKGNNSPQYLLNLDYDELVLEAQKRMEGLDLLKKSIPV